MKSNIFLFLVFLALFCASCNTESTNKNPYTNAKIEIKTFMNSDSLSTWGYDIYIFDAQYIHQPHIPAINGLKGFRTERDAQKTAEFVVSKIRNNIMPPMVNVGELDSLGVLK